MMSKQFYAVAGMMCSCLVAPVLAAEGWVTDLPAAMQKAGAENKLVLVEFTGSDWCHACLVLRRTVLDTAGFREYAAGRFVPVVVDLPHRADSDPVQRAKNEALAGRYGVAGYPTVLVLNAEGEVMGGFQGGDLKFDEVVQALENARQVADLRRKAAGLAGVPRARVLCEAYRLFPGGKMFARSQDRLRAEILLADPENVTGMREAEAVLSQARLFAVQRAAWPVNSPEMGRLLARQLADALPPNRAEVMLEHCQYLLATAETPDDIHTAHRHFEEVVPLLPPDKGAEIRHFIDTYFRDSAALLQMLKASRPR